MLELMRNHWALLRDAYEHDRTNLTGYDLINIFINCNEQANHVKIYTTDDDWMDHGTFVLIHYNINKSDIYLNTLSGSLRYLENLLSSLQLNDRLWFCGYKQVLKLTVNNFCLERGLSLKKLDQMETYVYYLPKTTIETFDSRLIADINFAPLDLRHAALVDEHWPYRSTDSLALIEDRIQNHISVGAFDGNGQLLAWCLRAVQGSLSNLYVLPSYRRLGLASLLVRHMAREIAATGAEVLATIAFGNEISQLFFEKMGFKLMDSIVFTMVPAL
ncbi:uncharacterized protein LOC108649937 [Drosophila navojoa]|uniref:uncharacterized protein LOC108649937 n=1 Tax=Drosophila navojoa TaxID=7232 RepID=UPI0011BEFBF1|nr:uncharacterized protein LOC108649937 [Drosophila navojoa]